MTKSPVSNVRLSCQAPLCVLITAGPTREHLDPVRFLTSASSGEMGIRLAAALRRRGASVTLVIGPTSRDLPKNVKVHRVTTALEMFSVVKRRLPRADAFVATAAVSDWRFAKVSSRKIKKEDRHSRMSLSGIHIRRKAHRLDSRLRGNDVFVTLVPNPDILGEAGRRKMKSRLKKPLLVGFALETGGVEAYAKKKLREKNLDLIIGNKVDSLGNPRIRALWLEKSGEKRWLPRMTKAALSEKIARWVMTCAG